MEQFRKARFLRVVQKSEVSKRAVKKNKDFKSNSEKQNIIELVKKSEVSKRAVKKNKVSKS
ncbi:MAG: hypothetical protein RSC35_06400, partial [Mucinivorans sp.]